MNLQEAIAAAEAAGIPRSLAQYLPTYINVESGFNPVARTGQYSGLLQMSPQQIVQYGGNAVQQGINLFADNYRNFVNKYGRDPTPSELYMAHQQGAGGLAQHLANPDAPAWQNMLNTGEGARKGATWAKAAIWNNLPEEAKKQFGNVNNVTSRDFMNVWDQRVNHDQYAPPPSQQPQAPQPAAPAPQAQAQPPAQPIKGGGGSSGGAGATGAMPTPQQAVAQASTFQPQGQQQQAPSIADQAARMTQPAPRAQRASLSARPGVNMNVDPRLQNILGGAAAQFQAAHPGYTVQAISGERPGGGQHSTQSGAVDVQITGPNGPIPNYGNDTTGLYTEFARTAYGQMQAQAPELQGKFAWGGAFGTERPTGGPPDLMHFDIGGERGHFTQNRLSTLGPIPASSSGAAPPATQATAYAPEAAGTPNPLSAPMGNKAAAGAAASLTPAASAPPAATASRAPQTIPPQLRSVPAQQAQGARSAPPPATRAAPPPQGQQPAMPSNFMGAIAARGTPPTIPGYNAQGQIVQIPNPDYAAAQGRIPAPLRSPLTMPSGGARQRAGASQPPIPAGGQQRTAPAPQRGAPAPQQQQQPQQPAPQTPPQPPPAPITNMKLKPNEQGAAAAAVGGLFNPQPLANQPGIVPSDKVPISYKGATAPPAVSDAAGTLTGSPPPQVMTGPQPPTVTAAAPDQQAALAAGLAQRAAALRATLPQDIPAVKGNRLTPSAPAVAGPPGPGQAAPPFQPTQTAPAFAPQPLPAGTPPGMQQAAAALTPPLPGINIAGVQLNQPNQPGPAPGINPPPQLPPFAGSWPSPGASAGPPASAIANMAPQAPQASGGRPGAQGPPSVSMPAAIASTAPGGLPGNAPIATQLASITPLIDASQAQNAYQPQPWQMSAWQDWQAAPVMDWGGFGGDWGG